MSRSDAIADREAAVAGLREVIELAKTNLNYVLEGDGLELVTFEWSTEFDECYECGLPAAYVVPDAYGKTTLGVTHLRCCRCAALAAADGERVVHIFAEDEDGNRLYTELTDLKED